MSFHQVLFRLLEKTLCVWYNESMDKGDGEVMEYRKLPHGNEKIGTLGLGMGGIQNTPQGETEPL